MKKLAGGIIKITRKILKFNLYMKNYNKQHIIL